MANGELSIFGFRVNYTNNEFAFYDKSTGELISEAEVVNRIYTPENPCTPYTDKDYQQDWIAFVSLCLASVVSYKIYCSQTLDTKNFVPSLPRTFMNSDEALHHITCYPSDSKLPKKWSEVLAEAYSHIQNRELATETTHTNPRLKSYLPIG